MANIGVIKMRSNGQIVIPQEMQAHLNEGDKLIVLQNHGRLILKKIVDLNNLEDLEFAHRTEEAWKRIEIGEGIEMDFDNFLKEIKKW